jgi:hypothetical protein
MMIVLVLAGAGCGDDDVPAVDMGAMRLPDADTAADMNLPPPVDLGGVPGTDLGADLGSTTTDGGGATGIPAICASVCDALGTCFGMPAGPDCTGGCAPDLADCSPEQLAAIMACATAGCTPEGDPPMPKIVSCLQAVTCIDIGGGTPPPPPPPPPAM